MVRHVVLFWMKDNSPEILREAASRLKSMEGKIEGMISIETGVDSVHSPRSCDLCLIEMFDSMESLEKYRTHPVHLPVQAFMHSVMDHSASADYVIE